MYKQISIFLCIVWIFLGMEHSFSQETGTALALDKQQIISQINDEVYQGAVPESSAIVIPLINEYASIATLVAKNIFDILESNNNEHTKFYYNLGINKSIKNIDDILNEPQVKDYDVKIIVFILHEVAGNTKRRNKYGIGVEGYNYQQEKIYSAVFEDTLVNFFDNTNVDGYNINTIIAAIQDYINSKNISIIQIKPKKGEVPNFRIEIDGTPIETVSLSTGYAYFRTGAHDVVIYKIDPNSTTNQERGQFKVSFQTKSTKQEYIQGVDFGDFAVELLIDYPFSIDLLGGVDLSFIAGVESVGYAVPVNIQTRYTLQQKTRLPLYAGLMLKYNIIDTIDTPLYGAESYNRVDNAKSGTRSLIGILPEAGFVMQLNDFMVMHVGAIGGMLMYSESFSDMGQYSSPFTAGTLFPAYGVNISFAEHIGLSGSSSRFYVLEQIDFLFVDYKLAHNYTIFTPKESQMLMYKNKKNETIAGFILSISLGVGMRF